MRLSERLVRAVVSSGANGLLVDTSHFLSSWKQMLCVLLCRCQYLMAG
jgi:hypothetical protein